MTKNELEKTVNEIEKTVVAMRTLADKMLNNAKSIHAPCENAYTTTKSRMSSCSCWRCLPKERP